ncbi:MAG: recombination mediator RecR [Acidobacteriota bacterium]
MFEWAKPLYNLIEELKKIPGIGAKTAQRISFHLMKSSYEDVERLSNALLEVRQKLFNCSICNNITDVDPCLICSDTNRNDDTICVVEEPYNVGTIEKTGIFKGGYHVLMGAISPIHGITPDKLKINGLVKRVEQGKVKEVIIATNPTVEGESTSLYLIKLLKPFNIKITRLAIGLPVGSDIDFADQVTISRALEGRWEIK